MSRALVQVRSVPKLSLNEKKRLLARFELCMFQQEATKEEFERFFSRKLYLEVDNALYLSWVPLKVASLGENFTDFLQTWEEFSSSKAKLLSSVNEHLRMIEEIEKDDKERKRLEGKKFQDALKKLGAGKIEVVKRPSVAACIATKKILIVKES